MVKVLRSSGVVALLGLFVLMLSGCAGIPKVEVPGAKKVVKKAVAEATVEVLEVKMEKIAEGASEEYGTIKITGKAVYHPAKVGGKAFKDMASDPRFNLLDAAGRKVQTFNVPLDCGEYGKAENVVAGEPFPFEGENSMVKKANWLIIESVKLNEWKVF
ncbi:hypothetical protein KAW65_06680 [candidate division WOR-3 bacterium]|nr:hypothetical protein [candidate division WOR-3 bacterium]